MSSHAEGLAESSRGPKSHGQRRQRDSPPPPKQTSSRRTAAPKVRTSHACDRCRMMRTKCSGGEWCTKCTKDNATCVFGDRKRERTKKDLAESLDRISSLEDGNRNLVIALRAVIDRPDFQPGARDEIVEILAKHVELQEDDDAGTESGSQSRTAPSLAQHTSTSGAHTKAPKGEVSGENTASASEVGSLGQQGVLPHVVNLDFGRGAAGFIGKMSEISWIQRAFETVRSHEDKVHPGLYETKKVENLEEITDFEYFLDDTDVLAIDEDYVDHYHWPSTETVVILSEAFFHAMQGAYPFVLREQFLQEAFIYKDKGKIPSWRQRRWLSMANLLWATGSKWLHMTKMDDPALNEDHVVYYARARALGLDHRVTFDHPDIERVEGIGLLAFYLLINGSITRAWNTLGHAIRHATSLGLHLLVADENVPKLERVRRARTWHSLYSLEILIAEITGRPKSIVLLDVTIPIELLQSVSEEAEQYSGQVDHFMSPNDSRKVWLGHLHAGRQMSQMTGGVVPWKSFASVGRNVPPSYLPQRLSLCRLSDKIASQTYSSGITKDPWSEIQRKVGNLQTELRQWAETLPEELAIQGSHEFADMDPRTMIELGMYYHSVEMILHRHCLCEVNIDNESASSKEFNRSSARACVHAAMSMLRLMPDYPTAHEAYQLLPWWELLHFLAQATSVLLLELALDAQHVPDEVPQLATYLRKAMGYLWCMTEGSLSAYRAWRIFRQLLFEVLQQHGDLDLADIPVQAHVPPGWSDELEDITTKAFTGQRR